MKKKILSLLPLLLVPFTLTGCEQDKAALTYGTLIKNDIYSLKEITTNELVTKSKDDQEVFLLAVYQGQYSETCLCWNTYLNILATYTNTYHEMVYIYNGQSQDDSIKNLGINKYDDSTPCVYIFNGTKKVASFSYRNSGDKAIFEDTTAEAMKTRVHKYIDKPTMYYVDEDYMAEHYEQDEKMCVMFMRHGCGDCAYTIPNVIIPYIKKHSLATDLYLFDIQKPYDSAKSEFATEEDKNYYQSLKDSYGLSTAGNEIFGYQNGVVPTIQFVKKGVIDGASVYFNDTITKKDDGSFYVSNSYYSEERLPHLKYLKGHTSSPTVLKELTITEGVVQNKMGGYCLSQDAASKLHRPLLEAFFDYYMFGY